MRDQIHLTKTQESPASTAPGASKLRNRIRWGLAALGVAAVTAGWAGARVSPTYAAVAPSVAIGAETTVPPIPDGSRATADRTRASHPAKPPVPAGVASPESAMDDQTTPGSDPPLPEAG